MTVFFKTLLITTFALWFGGFTFYVSFVVPIGTEILGSASSQGMITQQVTHRLNAVCGIAFLFMLLEAFRSWRPKVGEIGNRNAKWIQLAMAISIGVMLIALVGLHPRLDALVDIENQSVHDHETFYGLHRIYLWISTVQWVAGWVWIIATLARWHFEKNLTKVGKTVPNP